MNANLNHGLMNFSHRPAPRYGLAAFAGLMLVIPSLAADRPQLKPGENNWMPPAQRGTPLTTQDLASGLTPEDLVNALLGPGVTVTNIQYHGVNIAAGTFAGGTGIIGFESGIVLSSGAVAFVPGPNSQDATSADNAMPGDADLDALIPGYVTYDATVLEFDFTCSEAQFIVFRYALTSEEYNEWVNSPYNDVFGFFLNGVNIAEVPGSSGLATSINNVNCDNPYNPPLGSFCNLYINNDCDDIPPGGYPCSGARDTEMDGLTVVLTAAGTMLPGTNHIKLAVSDAGDPVLDSNVFIEGQSFACGTPIGACCHSDTLTCTDYVAQDACTGANDVWNLGLFCSQLDPPCAPAQGGEGEDCEHAIAINSLPHVEMNSTCTMDNDYTNTCLGTYDNGDDILYALSITSSQTVSISVSGDTAFDNWIGLAVADTCPPALSCLASATTSGTVATISDLLLTPGTYYLMVDNWPTDDECLNYTLTILSDAPATGACCENGFCSNSLTAEACSLSSGSYLGDGSTCSMDACPTQTCAGDANGDGTVDPLDSGFVQARFGCQVGTGNSECDAADTNGDLLVDPLDVGYVLARFGPCSGPTPGLISGAVEYTGTEAGTIHVQASLTTGSGIAYSTTLAEPGPFDMDIWTAGFYDVFAFMDVNANGQQDSGEPYAPAGSNPYHVAEPGSVVENVIVNLDGFSISGLVAYPSGNPASGVTITAVGPITSSINTGTDGTFALPNLVAGDYMLTPTHLTRYFYPFDEQVTLVESDVTGVFFEAHNLPPGEVDGMSKGFIHSFNLNNYSIVIDEDGTLITIFVYAGTEFKGEALSFEEIVVGNAIEAEFWTSPINLATVITTDLP